MKMKGKEMTSPEKIEELLNRFGQTISDLPERQDINEPYKRAERRMASASACEWYLKYSTSANDLLATKIPDGCRETILRCFICHQSDVIERLVKALEAAEKVASCDFCKKHESKCGNCSGYECTGFQIMDMEQIKKDMEARL